MATSDPNVVRRSTPLDEGSEEDLQEAAPKKSRKKLVVILLILLLLLGAGGGGAWYFFMGKKDVATKEGENVEAVADGEEAEPPVFVKLDTFTVNLQPDENAEYVLQIMITLQIKKEEDIERLKLYKPQIQSRIILLLSSKKASEISNVTGKQKLAEELVAAVSDPLYAGAKPISATTALFTSFIIQ